jgi:hypothetical protein
MNAAGCGDAAFFYLSVFCNPAPLNQQFLSVIIVELWQKKVISEKLSD